jgi:hypothetical protein
MPHYKDALRNHLVLNFFPKWQQHVVHNHEPIFGVVHDECEFVGMEPQIQSMENSACDRNAKIGFEVGMVVPHERGYAVSLTQSRSN